MQGDLIWFDVTQSALPCPALLCPALSRPALTQHTPFQVDGRPGSVTPAATAPYKEAQPAEPAVRPGGDGHLSWYLGHPHRALLMSGQSLRPAQVRPDPHTA